MIRAQNVVLKSLKIRYVNVKPLYLAILELELPVARSYSLKSVVKLGSSRKNFNVTFLENLPDKSCPNSFFKLKVIK